MRLFVDIQTAYSSHQDILTGIHRYVTAHAGWEMAVPEWEGASANLAPDCDGFILRQADHPLLARSGIRNRAVLISGNVRRNVPQVWHDDLALAAAGLDYLDGLGFRRFLVRSDDCLPSLHRRMAGFADLASQRGHRVAVYVPDAAMRRTPNVDTETVRLAEVIGELDKPLALIGYETVSTRRLVGALHRLGIAIPDQVAVFALEDIPLAATTINPAIAAVRVSGEQLGYAAVETLQAHLDGRHVTDRLFPPLGISERASARRLPDTNDLVGRALRLVEERPGHPWDVAVLAAAVGVGRRSLERAFIAAIGRSPGKEIRRIRLDRAMDMLLKEDTPITAIARRCGFSSHSAFCHAFKQAFGRSPGASR